MAFELDVSEGEDERMLRRAVRDFAAARSPVKRARDGRVSREAWREMARLGWLGLMIPEAHGGSGLGAGMAAIVAEELGRNLAPEPYVATVWLAAAALPDGDGARLAAIASGEKILALAWQERGARFDPERVATTAAPAEDGAFAITGEKVQVAAGTVADELIVSARDPGGALGLYAVARGAAGVTVEPQALLDRRDAALVRCAGARGERVGDAAALARALDLGAVGLAAEMLGGMAATFEMTLAYLKTRVQFGAPIGSFQALQHRAGWMFVELELARAAVAAAAAAPSARAASVAKAKCSDAFLHLAFEGVQMHGGIGMTEEHDVGLYLKRARTAEMTLGDAVYHRDRFARLSGW